MRSSLGGPETRRHDVLRRSGRRELLGDSPRRNAESRPRFVSGRRPRNQILFMNRIDHIRALARSLRGLPPVSLSEIARHWAVDPDTARRVLRAKGVSPTPGPWGRPRYSWLDVWRIDGVPDARLLRPEGQDALTAPLMTAGDVAAIFGVTQTTVRNWARRRVLPSIRIGGSIRFSPSDVDRARCPGEPVAPQDDCDAGP